VSSNGTKPNKLTGFLTVCCDTPRVGLFWPNNQRLVEVARDLLHSLETDHITHLRKRFRHIGALDMIKDTCIRIGAAAVFALAQTAFAAPITLTLTGPIAGKVIGPQSNSNPCIIAGTQCQNPSTFGFNDFTSNGNLPAYDLTSTNDPSHTVDATHPAVPYTVGQIETTVGSSFFDIAIDVNTTGAQGETLTLFEVIVDGTVIYNYVGPTVIGAINNNGNGYADWTLGVVDVSSFNDSSTVLFRAQWSGASDGAESFFLVADNGVIPPTGLVPEPSTLALLGLAMLGVGVSRRRKV